MEERLGRIVAMTGKLCREHFDRDLTSVGSSLNTYLVLRTAAGCPNVSQRQLAATLGIEGPTLTHHLDRLTMDGLLERVPHPSDRRVSTVVLTPAGHAHLERIEAFAEERETRFRALFTPDEVATLVGLLTRIRDRLSEEEYVRDPA